MRFDAIDFLVGLFGDRGATTAGESQAMTPGTNNEPPSFDFSNWVRRPDCDGRWGYEPADLPEADRWWARRDFEQLPVVDGHAGGPPNYQTAPQTTRRATGRAPGAVAFSGARDVLA